MPPRPPLRRHLHDNCQRHVLNGLPQRQSRRSISPDSTAFGGSISSTSESADTSKTTTTPFVQDERQTWRMRADGKRRLPLPPILDPIAISQRERWIEPKKPAAAPAERTPFQKKLLNNAFAHMLSAPIRTDRKLGLALPSSFLVPFRPLRHPSTDAIWLVPSANSGHALAPTKAAGSFNAWALARAAHLRALGNAKKGAWRGLTAPEQNETMSCGNTHGAVWRADMDDVVLGILRENARKALRYGFGKPRGGGVLARLWEEPGKGFVPYVKDDAGEGGNAAAVRESSVEEVEDVTHPHQKPPQRSLPEQLARHQPPAALLLLRSLSPLSTAPLDAVSKSLDAVDELVNMLIHHKRHVLKVFYPGFVPGPHSRWAYVERVQPRLTPKIRYGSCRPALVRWTACADMVDEAEGEALALAQATSTPPSPSPTTAIRDDHHIDHGAAQPASKASSQPPHHSRLIPVYSLPDLLGGDEALATFLGKQGERLWGRTGAVLLKAGPGAVGALVALERLRMYVDVPW
ncbi:hypothetical protein HDK64DRAFT_318331 [Phyllosticta capitalensis]